MALDKAHLTHCNPLSVLLVPGFVLLLMHSLASPTSLGKIQLIVLPSWVFLLYIQLCFSWHPQLLLSLVSIMVQLNIELGNSPTTTLTQALPTTTKPANDFFFIFNSKY